MATIIVVLHNIRSVYNVGAIFRTADGAGVSEIMLVGYTPTPIDRFGRPRADIAKAALGAEVRVPWRQFDTIEQCVEELRAQGVSIVAVEQAETAIPYTAYKRQGPTAFIFGNEILGVPPEIITSADACIHIGMSGMKESLNVSVAVGVILFAARDSS